jgi:CDP-diacylglycerol--glycerol-3-phosphate 3-phosphatidyltransferase
VLKAHDIIVRCRSVKQALSLGRQEDYSRHMKWTIPNILTTLRLLAAPGVVLMFLYFTRPWADWFALILFVSAAVTDWFDGYLARLWKQESKLGAMLDPIADKAMVVIALLVITGYAGMDPWILLPATVIMFREVFVSGLREFLGDTAGTLKVTKLAKWKTTAQMVAIAVLFATGIFQHMLIERTVGMDAAVVAEIFEGGDDPLDLRLIQQAYWLTWWIGVALLWIAAALTLVTGFDYFRKSLPYLKDER